ncbi:hypothetical protein BASA81_007355 [Batrachochytrium salamandrivorans]|nr:hypothetical protein BASA81_007355 [Batrachochytrium salamandrivorans]
MRMQERMERWIAESIDKHRMPTGEVVVFHHGKVICQHRNVLGLPKPKEDMTYVYRLYSMTKPIVCCAVMMLVEERKLQLHDPIHTVLGEAWKRENLRVVDHSQATTHKPGSELPTVPCEREITFHHLLSHTSGMSHGLSEGVPHVVDLDYYYRGISGGNTVLLSPGQSGFASLDDFLNRLSQAPLLFQPGEGWEYAYGFEVLGRVIELVAKQSLDLFLRERIFTPLNMKDTGFFLNKEQQTRLCPLFTTTGGMLHAEPTHFPANYCCGSAGLYSTLHDYLQFALMLANGGLVGGTKRILQSSTVDVLFTNQLQGQTCAEMARYSNPDGGTGFTYCGAVILDNTMGGQQIASVGELGWKGAGQTSFWIDKDEELVVVFMTSVLLGADDNINATLHSLVYGALDRTKPRPPN